MDAKARQKRVRLVNLILKAALLADETDALLGNGAEAGSLLYGIADELGKEVQ